MKNSHIAAVIILALLVIPSLARVQAVTVQELLQQIQLLQQQVDQLKASGAVGSQPTSVTTAAQGISPFARNLAVGSTGTDVHNLQVVLNTDPQTQVAPAGQPGGPGSESTYYGPKTAAAVSKFQSLHDLPQVGSVGPLTRAELNETISGSGGVATSGATAAANCPPGYICSPDTPVTTQASSATQTTSGTTVTPSWTTGTTQTTSTSGATSGTSQTTTGTTQTTTGTSGTSGTSASTGTTGTTATTQTTTSTACPAGYTCTPITSTTGTTGGTQTTSTTGTTQTTSTTGSTQTSSQTTSSSAPTTTSSPAPSVAVSGSSCPVLAGTNFEWRVKHSPAPTGLHILGQTDAYLYYIKGMRLTNSNGTRTLKYQDVYSAIDGVTAPNNGTIMDTTGTAGCGYFKTYVYRFNKSTNSEDATPIFSQEGPLEYNGYKAVYKPVAIAGPAGRYIVMHQSLFKSWAFDICAFAPQYAVPVAWNAVLYDTTNGQFTQLTSNTPVELNFSSTAANSGIKNDRPFVSPIGYGFYGSDAPDQNLVDYLETESIWEPVNRNLLSIIRHYVYDISTGTKSLVFSSIPTNGASINTGPLLGIIGKGDPKISGEWVWGHTCTPYASSCSAHFFNPRTGATKSVSIAPASQAPSSSPYTVLLNSPIFAFFDGTKLYYGRQYLYEPQGGRQCTGGVGKIVDITNNTEGSFNPCLLPTADQYSAPVAYKTVSGKSYFSERVVVGTQVSTSDKIALKKVDYAANTSAVIAEFPVSDFPLTEKHAGQFFYVADGRPTRIRSTLSPTFETYTSSGTFNYVSVDTRNDTTCSLLRVNSWGSNAKWAYGGTDQGLKGEFDSFGPSVGSVAGISTGPADITSVLDTITGILTNLVSIVGSLQR